MSGGQLAWLFFGFSGRIDRSVYALAALLVFVVQMFIIYRYLLPYLGLLASGTLGPEEALVLDPMSALESVAFLVAQVSHVALAAKRIHDFGKSGFFALLFVLAGFIAYIFLCVVPGTPGPNAYGQRTNARS